MKCSINSRDEDTVPKQAFIEEQFFEQFAALEEGVAAVQDQLRDLAEHARRFDALVTQMRRSICPAAGPSRAAGM